MFIVGKYKDLYANKPVNVGFKVMGEVRLILRNSMGGVVQDTGWKRNLITDHGLNTGFHRSDWINYFHIGTSSTAPAVSDTTLGGWLAYSNASVTGVSSVNNGSPNYEGVQTIGRRFAVGVGTGTIRELGLSYVSSNANMCVRILVSPAVVKAADQVLDVFYRGTLYPDLIDKTGVITIDSIDYDYTTRMSNIMYTGSPLGVFGFAPGTFSAVAYSGSIGVITDVPSGIMTGAGGYMPYADTVPYQTAGGSGSGLPRQDFAAKWGLDRGNHASGFKCSRNVFSRWTGANNCSIQTQYVASIGGASIPKDETKELTLEWRFSWSRH